MFWLNLSWQLVVGKVVFKGPFLTAGCCLFCLTILCVLCWIIQNCEVLKHTLKILVYIRIDFWIPPLLFKGLHKYYLEICDIFEMEFLEKYKKKETKNRHAFYTTTVTNIPVNNSKSKFCNGLFKNKIIHNLAELFACPFFGALKWDHF